MLDLGIPFHLIYNMNDVFPLAEHAFEDTSFSVPANCSHMLTDMYGDYMTLPKDLDHVYHHVEKLEFYD
jgi:lipopolysaccharide cholinephosphotransferase